MTDYSKYDNHIFKFIVANERWFEKADKDSDGILLSGEFASYFESSMNFEDWDGEVTNSNDEKDILKNFFARMIDTNKAKGHIDGYKNIANEFAADVTEIDAFKNGKIASYNEILNAINVYCPDYIENKESWKSKVTGQIVSLYGNSSSNVENFVDTDPCQDVLAQVTSEMLLKQCLEDENFAYITIGNTALTTLIASDTTLKSLIETYVENVCDDANTNFDSDQMEKDIKGIINEYFNYAGLDNLNIKLYDSANDSTDDNVIATYDGDIRGLNNSLTSLQTEVAKAEISSRVIKGFQEKYLDYYSNFQSYVKSFVTSVISEVPTGSWENNIPDWDSLAMKFETSTQKTNLDKYIENLKTPTPPVEEFPVIEEPIVEKTLCQEAKDRTSKIMESDDYKSLQKLSAEYAEQFNKMLLVGFMQTGNEYKESVKTAISSIYSTNDSFREVITELFGDNYIEKINSLSWTDVQTKINSINAMYQEKFGQKIELMLETEFSAEISQLGLTVDQLDSLFDKILTLNEEFNRSIDGVLGSFGGLNIPLQDTIESCSNIIYDMLNDSNAKDYYLNNDPATFKIDGVSISDIYADIGQPCKSTRTLYHNLSSACADAKELIFTIIDSILLGFRVKGYAPQAIENAAKLTQNYYTGLLEAVSSKGRFTEEISKSNPVGESFDFSYKDLDGNDVSSFDHIYWNADTQIDVADDSLEQYINGTHNTKGQFGIIFVSNDNQNLFEFAINPEGILDRFISFI